MSAKPCVIVDIDGTLAEFDAEFVKPWVLGSEKQWLPFFEHMADALTNMAIASWCLSSMPVASRSLSVAVDPMPIVTTPKIG